MMRLYQLPVVVAALAVCVMIFVATAHCQPQQQFQSQVLNNSGDSAIVTNNISATQASFGYVVQGQPSSLTMTVQGCDSSNSCGTIDTYSSTFNTTRKPTLASTYAYFNVSGTWTGGTNVQVTVNSTLTVPSSSGGTISPLTTKGDIYTFSSTNTRLAIGADGTCFLADSTQPTGNKWAACPGGGTTPTGTGFTHITGGAQDGASKLVNLTAATDVAANQGTTTTVLHGNAAGQTSFGAIVLTTDVSGILPVVNGGTALASGTSGGILGYTASGTLASSVAQTVNVLIKGGGAGATPTPSLVTDDATTLTYTGTGGLTLNGTASKFTSIQGTITTSNPFVSHTATWNAAGVAFTNQLSNITCTAAATASIAAGWGTAGTQWQLKYAAANCASPQILSPDGTATNPAWGYSSAANWGMYKIASGGINYNAFTVDGNNDVGLGNARVAVPSNGGFFFSNSNTDALGTPTASISRPAAGVFLFTATSGRTGFTLTGNSVFVTSNFTTSGVGTALENITGLTWVFPTGLAANWNFHCHIGYSQAVGTAAVAFGIKATTNNPTNIFGTGEMFTASGTVTTGILATLATQTATNIVSGTPGGTGTNLPVDLFGTMELPSAAITINIMTSTATAADTVTVLRGSYCSLTP